MCAKASQDWEPGIYALFHIGKSDETKKNILPLYKASVSRDFKFPLDFLPVCPGYCFECTEI
jgi:hypothetical protein